MECHVKANQYLIGECDENLEIRNADGLFNLCFCDTHWQQMLDCAKMIQVGYTVEDIKLMDAAERAEKLDLANSGIFVQPKTETERMQEKIDTLTTRVTELENIVAGL